MSFEKNWEKCSLAVWFSQDFLTLIRHLKQLSILGHFFSEAFHFMCN